ncbi:MAG: hypothetical protein ACPLZD_08530 [Candidatus Saccharicenans sp.]|nr:MAG: hypothetical protein C0168_09255 [Candidatus Aminicenantes bacterium]HEK85964.1 hypothetical protein [Candidatus Aminicenantes bacterium]
MLLKSRKASKYSLPPTAIISTLLFFLLLIYTGQALLAESSSENKTSWQMGLSTDLFNRGVKLGSDKLTLKSLSFLLEARAMNLPGLFDLDLYAGLNKSKLNGALFDHLPITLDYEAGYISGLIFGGKISKGLLKSSNFRFGLTADFTTYIGFKKTYTLSDFVVPANVQAEPDWAMASGGIFVLYDGFVDNQPFLEITFSKLWGTFKVTETIQDLTGQQSKNLKDAGPLSLTLGWNINLTKDIIFIPRVRIYTGSRTTIGAGLSLLYAL